VVDQAKSDRVFGFDPTRLRDAIRRTPDWYQMSAQGTFAVGPRYGLPECLVHRAPRQ
jgi:hypothetical protein